MSGYVKLFRSIWEDPDFVALPAEAQRLYVLMISQKTLSHVGVLPLTLSRWATLSPNTDASAMRAALIELEVANFVLVDYDTEEVLVRSYVIHDGQYRNPNGMKALVGAYALVVSQRLRKALTTIAATVGAALPPSPDRPTRQAPSQAPSEAPSPGGTPGDAAPLAASNLQPTTSSSSRTRGRTTQPPVDNLPAAAAAAIEILIEHRMATERPRSPDRYRLTLTRALPAEHGEALVAHLAEHPDAEPSQLAAAVFGLSELDLFRSGVLGRKGA